MEKLELNFKVITPMFLHGISREVELRVPSIRGMLHFWWRATQVREGITHAELRQREMDIFGGIGDNQAGGKKSAISLRVDPWIITDSVKEQMLPHRSKGTANAIKPELTFRVQVKFDENKISTEKLKALFFIVSTLGGLGKRSRRGFGSFEGLSSTGENDIAGKIFFSLKCLNDGMFEREESEELLMDKIKLVNLVDIAYPYIKEIEIGKSKSSYNELLVHIGKASSAYNSRATGNAIGGRQASPIYVSIIKAKENTKLVFKPIVTTLHNTEVYKLSKEEKEKAENFVKAVLGKI